MKLSEAKALTIIGQKIDEKLNDKSQVIVGIDGMAASGKTSFAKVLKEKYNAIVIHMDDFFLQDIQKTEKRLSEVDGFIDYERFEKEVVKPLKKGSFSKYHVYDCQAKTMTKKNFEGSYQVIIIEGAYALRQDFIDVYDIKILKLIDERNQIMRISKRNKPSLIKRFIEEWIPRENLYIKSSDLQNKVDFKIIS